jgi:hypothetical protein
MLRKANEIGKNQSIFLTGSNRFIKNNTGTMPNRNVRVSKTGTGTGTTLLPVVVLQICPESYSPKFPDS